MRWAERGSHVGCCAIPAGSVAAAGDDISAAVVCTGAESFMAVRGTIRAVRGRETEKLRLPLYVLQLLQQPMEWHVA